MQILSLNNSASLHISNAENRQYVEFFAWLNPCSYYLEIN